MWYIQDYDGLYKIGPFTSPEMAHVCCIDCDIHNYRVSQLNDVC